MGDDLAQILFETLQAQGPDLPPFRRAAWNDLDLESQEHWKAVALKARMEMGRRFRNDIRDAVAELGAEQVIANLLDDEAN